MEIKNIKAIVKELCSLEGQKVQIDVAQMSEVVHKLSALMYLCPEVGAILTLNGQKIVKETHHSLNEKQ